MGVEKSKIEAGRWLKTAEEDLQTARILFDNERYAHACFHAQQSAEKALKALWYRVDASPWGHSAKKLIDDLAEVDPVLFDKIRPMQKTALILDRYYIPTRYPNGLPDLTPDQVYIKEDAKICIQNASEIVQIVHGIVP